MFKIFNILIFYYQNIIQEWLFKPFLKFVHLAIMVQLHSPNVPQKSKMKMKKHEGKPKIQEYE